MPFKNKFSTLLDEFYDTFRRKALDISLVFLVISCGVCFLMLEHLLFASVVVSLTTTLSITALILVPIAFALLASVLLVLAMMAVDKWTAYKEGLIAPSAVPLLPSKSPSTGSIPLTIGLPPHLLPTASSEEGSEHSSHVSVAEASSALSTPYAEAQMEDSGSDMSLTPARPLLPTSLKIPQKPSPIGKISSVLLSAADPLKTPSKKGNPDVERYVTALPHRAEMETPQTAHVQTPSSRNSSAVGTSSYLGTGTDTDTPVGPWHTRLKYLSPLTPSRVEETNIFAKFQSPVQTSPSGSVSVEETPTRAESPNIFAVFQSPLQSPSASTPVDGTPPPGEVPDNIFRNFQSPL